MLTWFRYIEHLLIPPTFPKCFTSPLDLTVAAIRNFSRQSLMMAGRTLGPAAVLRPSEAQYQDELYRACYDLLGAVHLTSEWPGSSRGRIDFQVKSKRWGFEVVRDGANLDEHLSRFGRGGIYEPLLQSQEIQEYVVVDFRSPTAPRPKPRSKLVQAITYSFFNSI